MLLRKVRQGVPLLLLTLCSLASFSASAGVLFELQSGAATASEELLSQGLLLIYAEEDCVPCKGYLRALRECGPEITASLRYVSTDPASRAKRWARSLPEGSQVYLMKNRKDFSFLMATPTTQSRKGLKVGPLSCKEIKEMQP